MVKSRGKRSSHCGTAGLRSALRSCSSDSVPGLGNFHRPWVRPKKKKKKKVEERSQFLEMQP